MTDKSVAFEAKHCPEKSGAVKQDKGNFKKTSLAFVFPSKALVFFFSPTPTSPIRSKISLSCVIVYVSITVKVAKTGCSPPQWPPLSELIDWIATLWNLWVFGDVRGNSCSRLRLSSGVDPYGGWVGVFLGLGGSPRLFLLICVCVRAG